VSDELLIGSVVRVEEHPGARAPSLLLAVDLGTYGVEDVVLATGGYEPEELNDRQVVCRRDDAGAVIIAAHSHGAGLVLLRPDREVEPGTIVS
jgi:hypothetical protein